jgi:hypothetical protein
MRNPSRNVPQIIPVAMTIAVGKLMKGPPFQLTLAYGQPVSLVSASLGQTESLPTFR